VKFWRALLLIALVGFGIRVAYVAIAKGDACKVTVGGNVIGSYPTQCAVGDQIFYNTEADALASGRGFVDPLWSVNHPGQPAPEAADHPPLTAVVLAPVSWLSERPPVSWIAGDSLHSNMREHRYTMVVFGTVLIVLVGILGRRVGRRHGSNGDVVGLVAAAIAALTPDIWVNDGLVMSETITSVVVVLTLLYALDAVEKPTVKRIALLGALCSLCALARAELLLFVPLLVVPIAWLRARSWAALGVGVGASILVLAPWVGFNLARFDQPTFISTNDGLALSGSNCDPVYYGDGTGLTSFDTAAGCTSDPLPPGDQSEVARVYRNRARRYIDHHLGRAPVVALARVGRTWSLFRPADMITYNKGEGREEWETRLGLAAFYPTLVAAIAGVVVLWRRRRRWWCLILVSPAIVVTLSSAATYGQTRFRAAAEPSMAVLAAVAGVAAFEWLRSRQRSERAPESAPPEAAEMAPLRGSGGSGMLRSWGVNHVAT
jgi:hypothetical protein